MKVCQRCGANNPVVFNFCGQCAAPLTVRMARPVGQQPGSNRSLFLGSAVGAVIVGSTVVLAVVLAVATARREPVPVKAPEVAEAPTKESSGPALALYPKERIARGRKIVEREATSIGLAPYCAFAGQPPRLVVAVWDTTWKKLSPADRVNVTLAAEALIGEARNSPGKFIDPDIPTSAPAYPMALRNTRALGNDDWSVIVVVGKERYLDRSVAEGGTESARSLRAADSVDTATSRPAKAPAQPAEAAPASAPPPFASSAPAVERAPAPVLRANEETVYVTRTGEKYHRAGCRYLRQSMIPTKLSDARGRYAPCSVCRPPN
jgi:hypothetical protein